MLLPMTHMKVQVMYHTL